MQQGEICRKYFSYYKPVCLILHIQYENRRDVELEGNWLQKELIQAAREGDQSALAALLRELQDPWFRFCVGILCNVDHARDACQETGLRFIKTIANFRGESQLQTWSMGIALNVCREMRRKNRGLPEKAKDQVAQMQSLRIVASPASHSEMGDEKQKLEALLKDLPDRQRQAIVLRFYEEMSVEDTARLMDCATGTIKATIHQALRSLREKFKPHKPAKKIVQSQRVIRSCSS